MLSLFTAVPSQQEQFVLAAGSLQNINSSGVGSVSDLDGLIGTGVMGYSCLAYYGLHPSAT